MTAQRLTERQVRWLLLLSEYQFKLEFHAGKLAQRPDTLSWREQDMPQGNDKRLEEQVSQLLKDTWLPPVSESTTEAATIQALLCPLREEPEESTEKGSEIPSIARGSDIFEEPELQLLWDCGLVEDKLYKQIYQAITQEARAFPPELKLSVQLPECKIDHRGTVTR